MISVNTSKNNQIGVSHCSGCFHSLGVEAKYTIYKLLKSKGDCTVSEIVDHLNLSQPTVSYHLKNMESDGLLNRTKKGKEVHYSINEICPHDNKMCVLSSINLK